jgi:hypothetical protein
MLKLTDLSQNTPCGLIVRTGFQAGQAPVVCYQYVNGAWFQVGTPVPGPVPPMPTPPATGAVQWLECQSCTGTKSASGTLTNAKCEVCAM